MGFIFILAANFLFLLQIMLVVYFILSFFPLAPGGFFSQLQAFLARIFEPILTYLRRFIPSIGIFDMSGLVLIIAIVVLQRVFIALA